MPSISQPAYRPEQISGFDAILPSIRAGLTVKAILNEHGIAFFPVQSQHRDIKVLGLSYEDDYKGNALAAICTRERIEIRYHRDFPDPRVAAIAAKMAATPELASFSNSAEWVYQGRMIREPFR